MKSLLLPFYCFSILLQLISCSAEPPAQPVTTQQTADPEPYLYKPPVTPEMGLAVARVKKEALAEAFISRLSTKAPAGVVVMQQEKLVLEEYFGLDSSALICVDPLFPAYTGALLGSVYMTTSEVPFNAIPLEDFHPNYTYSASLWVFNSMPESFKKQQLVQQLEKLVTDKTGSTMGMAAEELLFEPLQIDSYKWQEGALCIHPHGLLQLGSLLVKRGRWGDHKLLPDVLVKKILAPAYQDNHLTGAKAFGWQYYRLMAKGRKQPVMYWKSEGIQLFIFPEAETVVLLQGDGLLNLETWEWIQDLLIPSLTL